MTTLDSTRRQHLRTTAHNLHAVILVGHAGLSEALITEIEKALSAHELVKIKWRDSDRNTRIAAIETLCDRLDASPVAHIGKHFVLWRAKPEKAEPVDRVRQGSASVKTCRAKTTTSLRGPKPACARHWREAPAKSGKGRSTKSRRR